MHYNERYVKIPNVKFVANVEVKKDKGAFEH